MKPLPSEDLEHVLAHTEQLWSRARGSEIFISGGTGFFGVWLLESLAYCNRNLHLNVRATVLTRDPRSFIQRMPHLAIEPCIRFLQGDIRDFDFPDQNFNYIVHAATPTATEVASRPLELTSALVRGTEKAISLARAKSVKSFLFVSSGAVYGPQPATRRHIPESYPGCPNGADPKAVYGEGKRTSEQMCTEFAKDSGTQVSIARCFTFVGPHLPLHQHFAIGNFIADALAGRNIAVRGDGTPMRSYLYTADLVIWLWTMLFRDTPAETNPLVLNVGSGDAISIRALAQEVIDELNPTLKIEVGKAPEPGQQLVQYVPNVREAEVALGLKQYIGLREAIRRTANWYR